MRKDVAPALGGLLGFLAVASSLGLSLVNPTNIEWVLHGDWSLHFLGWHLYRSGPWTLPLGATPLLVWPVGSSVGLTDSIPVASVLFKVLDPLLPADFQFIGLWLLLCFVLQGVFAVLLMRLATPRPVLQLLGAALLVMSPPLIFRIAHPALAAHWLLLAALWLYAKDGRDTSPSGRLDRYTARYENLVLVVAREAGRIAALARGARREDTAASQGPLSDGDIKGRPWLVGWVVLVGLAAAIQPYLLLMTLVVMVAAYTRRALTALSEAPRLVFHVVVIVAWAGIVLWQSGDFIVGVDDGLEILGFGAWSMNLVSLVMPTEGSTLLGPGPFAYATPGQYEGYAYLGAGVLLLAVIVVSSLPVSGALARWRRRAWRHLPLAIGFVFLTVMALGPVVTLGSRTLFEYSPSWWGLLSVFRSNGRMFWPVYYAIVLAILFGVTERSYRQAVVLLLIGVVLQGIDLSGTHRAGRDARTFGFRDPLRSRFWSLVPPRYERLVLLPTNLCTRDGFVDHTAFSLLAGRFGMAINAGTTARYGRKKTAAYCDALRNEIETGSISNAALYVVQPHLVAHVKAAAGTRVACAEVDGYGVCVAPETYRGWQDVYDVLAAALPDLAEFLLFYEALDAEYRAGLGRSPRVSPASAEARIGALVRYLAYRVGGCPHHEARAKTLRDVQGMGELRRCVDTSSNRTLPPPNETYEFRIELESVYQARPAQAGVMTWVDLEGEAVWVQEYAGHRLRGRSALEARDAVLAAVRAAAR